MNLRDKTTVVGKADLHIHSSKGDGLGSIEEMLDFVENYTDLDVVAVTDHDDIEGGDAARELAAKRKCSFEVVVGAEITTLEGHLLALFLERPVRSLQSLHKTVDAVHAQGGLCVVPHPMSWLTRSVGQRALEHVVSGKTQGLYLDGLEVINATIAGRVCNEKAQMLNRLRFKLAETGGSDAHFPQHIGSAYTVFEGRTSGHLRKGLEGKQTRAEKSTVRSRPAGLDELLLQQGKSLVVLPIKHIRRKVRRMMSQGEAE